MAGQVLQECTDKAISYLSRRMHSRKELSQKLLRAQFAAEVIELALSKLEKLGYVNDEEFARQKLQQAQRKLVGERRAVAELMRSGVKGEVAPSGGHPALQKRRGGEQCPETDRKEPASPGAP